MQPAFEETSSHVRASLVCSQNKLSRQKVGLNDFREEMQHLIWLQGAVLNSL